MTPLLSGFLDHGHEPVRKILDAAEQCLGRSGYGDTSIRDVAAEAGVSKSLVHYHFKSKEHLFLEVQIGVYNRLAAHVTEAALSVETGPERVLRALDALIEVLSDGAELGVHTELWARALGNEKMGAHARRLHDYLRKLVIRTIEQIVDPELLPVSPGVAADLLLAALTGLGLQSGFDDSPGRVDEALEGVRNVVILLLKVPQA